MKIKNYIVLLSFAFCSCAGKKAVSLKGSYPETPIQTQTEKKFSEVWDNLIDVFAQKGLPIKLIDRTSGLIVAESTLIPVTSEDKNGRLKDSSAYLVIPMAYDWGSNKYKALPVGSTVIGEWNIRVKEIGGKTNVNINIVNVKNRIFDKYKRESFVLMTDFKSTGVFEKTLSQLILK